MLHSIDRANAAHAYRISLDYDAVATHIRVMANTRINIVVTKPQLLWLEREAKRLGIRVGEVIRRLLDQVRDASK